MKQNEVQEVFGQETAQTVEKAPRFSGSRVAFFLLMCLMMSVNASAAVDFSSLTEGISDSIDGLITAIGPIGIALIGLGLFGGAIVYIRSLVRKG